MAVRPMEVRLGESHATTGANCLASWRSCKLSPEVRAGSLEKAMTCGLSSSAQLIAKRCSIESTVKMKAAEVSSLQQKWLIDEERKLRGLSIADTKREKRELERSLETMWNEQGLPKSMAKISKKELREAENDASIGGMRNPDLAVERLTLVREVGAKLRDEWGKIFAEEPDFAVLGSTYGKREAKFDEDLSKRWKERILAALGGAVPMEGVMLRSNTECKSPLDPELWQAWQVASKDPDLCIQQFIREGVPLGMSSKIPPSGGVFPPARNQETQAVEAQVEFEERQNMVNYASVQEHPRESQGTVSKLALILKPKPDGSVKKRIVIDMLRSGGNGRAEVPERIVLPRVSDVLRAMRKMDESEPSALNWLIAMLDANGFKMQARVMWLKEKPAEWEIISDASPMGIGAVLWKKDASSGSIQLIEAYAYEILRAVKLWQRRIQCKGLILKSDSSVALGIAQKLSSPPPTLNYIAAELACLLETIDIRQIEIYHVPGTFNKEADWLSRPRERGEMPESLQGVRLKKLKGQLLEDFKALCGLTRLQLMQLATVRYWTISPGSSGDLGCAKFPRATTYRLHRPNASEDDVESFTAFLRRFAAASRQVSAVSLALGTLPLGEELCKISNAVVHEGQALIAQHFSLES
eukprot:g12445.t1